MRRSFSVFKPQFLKRKKECSTEEFRDGCFVGFSYLRKLRRRETERCHSEPWDIPKAVRKMPCSRQHRRVRQSLAVKFREQVFRSPRRRTTGNFREWRRVYPFCIKKIKVQEGFEKEHSTAAVCE